MRSESEAFALAVAGAIAIAIAVAVGLLATPLAGVAVFAAILVLAAIAYLRAPNPDRRAPLREAAHGPHRHGPRGAQRHVLVVANEVLAGEELRELILGADGASLQVDVLAPVLLSRAHATVSDIDRELEQARARLRRSLAWLRDQGIDARGEVGDPAAATAIEDELRDFGADEVIVVTHAPGEHTWQERDELERLRSELDVPLTHIAASPSS